MQRLIFITALLALTACTTTKAPTPAPSTIPTPGALNATPLPSHPMPPEQFTRSGKTYQRSQYELTRVIDDIEQGKPIAFFQDFYYITFDEYTVTGLVGDYVIYRYQDRDRDYEIAIKPANKNGLFSRGAELQYNTHFLITGTEKFTTAFGGVVQLLTLQQYVDDDYFK